MLKLAQHLTLTVQPYETPSSFCSRIAFKANISSFDLARHCGIRYLDLADGNPEAIASLAEACGADANAFSETTIRNTCGRRYVIGAETITRDFLCRAQVRLCPQCIGEDLSGPEGKFGPYGRLEWLFEAVRACTRHRRLMVSLPPDSRPSRMHDFAFHLHNNLRALDVLDAAAIAVDPSPLITYIGDRIGNRASPNWLAAMPLYAAAKACEVMGAAILFGVHRHWNSISDLEWHAAGAAGFNLLSEGPAALHMHFRDLQQYRFEQNLGWAFKDTFGKIYDFLSHDSDDPGYEPLREVMYQHIVETVPVGPGDVVVGRKVTSRRLHSIHSAALETGIHVKTLRKQLRSADVIDEKSDGIIDDLVLFDAKENGKLLSLLIDSLGRKEAATYLNIPRPHDVNILECEFVQPLLRPGKHGLGEYAYARADLDAFLVHLHRKASPLLPADKGFAWVGNAAKRTCRPAAEIVDLLFQGTLEQVRLDPGATGFKSIMVNLDEVKKHLHPVNESLGLKEVETRLTASVGVVKALVDRGYLPVRTEIHPVSRLPTRLVEPADLETFMSTYVSLHVLAQEIGRHFRKLSQDLASHGVKPAFDRDKVHATFYLRSDLRPFWGHLRPPPRQ